MVEVCHFKATVSLLFDDKLVAVQLMLLDLKCFESIVYSQLHIFSYCSLAVKTDAKRLFKFVTADVDVLCLANVYRSWQK